MHNTTTGSKRLVKCQDHRDIVSLFEGDSRNETRFGPQKKLSNSLKKEPPFLCEEDRSAPKNPKITQIDFSNNSGNSVSNWWRKRERRENDIIFFPRHRCWFRSERSTRGSSSLALLSKRIERSIQVWCMTKRLPEKAFDKKVALSKGP